jgi:hypothetical protein
LLVYIQGSNGAPTLLEVVSVTDTQIVARIGAVRSDAQSGPLIVAHGVGSRSFPRVPGATLYNGAAQFSAVGSWGTWPSFDLWRLNSTKDMPKPAAKASAQAGPASVSRRPLCVSLSIEFSCNTRPSHGGGKGFGTPFQHRYGGVERFPLPETKLDSRCCLSRAQKANDNDMLSSETKTNGLVRAMQTKIGLGLVAATMLSLVVAAGAAAAVSAVEAVDASGGLGSVALRQDINPALLYWQAFDQRVEIPADVRKEMFAEPPTMALAEAEAYFARYDLVFERLRRAARMRVPCDWGSDPADGPEAYIPNLVTLRRTAQLVPVRVHYALEAGRDQLAVDDAMAGLVLGRHTSQSLTLVTTMIGLSIESLALKTVADHFQQLGPAALNSLRAQLDSAPARATVKQAMAKEKTLVLEWMITRLGNLRAKPGSDDVKALAEFRETMERMGNLADSAGLGQAGQSLDQMIASLQAMRPVYDWVQQVVSAPPDRLKPEHEGFQQKVELLKNPLVEPLVPNILKARQSELRLIAHLAMVRAAIALRVGGDEAFRQIHDPFGNRPFTLRRLGPDDNAAFELHSLLHEFDEREVAMKFTGGPKAHK